MLTLLALKNLIRNKQIANLQSLCQHFAANKHQLEPMLELLTAKGYITPTTLNQCGKTCTNCSKDMMKIYRWLPS